MAGVRKFSLTAQLVCPNSVTRSDERVVPCRKVPAFSGRVCSATQTPLCTWPTKPTAHRNESMGEPMRCSELQLRGFPPPPVDGLPQLLQWVTELTELAVVEPSLWARLEPVTSVFSHSPPKSGGVKIGNQFVNIKIHLVSRKRQLHI